MSTETPEQKARRFAKEMVESVRKSNAEYYESTGATPTVSEADYLAAEEEMYRVFMGHLKAGR
jgi:hypothetical protein